MLIIIKKDNFTLILFYGKKKTTETHENFSFDQAETYLKALFSRVSRTFALTVPELPMPLRNVVMNAYLLNRALDTIEDDNALALEQKFDFGKRFVEIVMTNQNAEEFALELTRSYPFKLMRQNESLCIIWH